MAEAWRHLISGDFMPHGHCYLWLPEILWTHVTADAITAAAYYSIPISIVAFVRKRRDVDFKMVPVLFSAFIFLCGTTHIMGIIVVWTGYYGIQGMLKAATAVVSIFTAIWIWKLLPAALAIPSRQQLNETIDDATSTLQERNRELAQANADVESFVSAASHDLKEPLRTLVAYCQLLEKDLGEDLSDEVKDDLGHITSGARRMQTLVNDILDLSAAGHAEVKPETIKLEDCINEALDSIEGQLAAAGANVHVGELPMIVADPVVVTQVYQNLISNAVKFARPGTAPEIRLTVEQAPDGTRIFGVEDNGIGIDEQYFDRVFEPFERLHGRDHSEGTGIGLAICRRSIERHGGKIWIEKGAAGGAHFRFTLRGESHADAANIAPYDAQTADPGR